MPLNLLLVKPFPLVLDGVIILQIAVGFGIFYGLEHFHQFGGNNDAYATIEPFRFYTEKAEVDDIGFFQGLEQP